MNTPIATYPHFNQEEFFMPYPIFYRPEMSIKNVDPFCESAGKPAEFMDMIRTRGPAAPIFSFNPVTKEDLYLVHDRTYVDGVFEGTTLNGFENRDMRVVQACLYTVGSLVAATNFAGNTSQQACSPSSGFHHAGYGWGGGYCTFNGLMVAAAKFLQTHPTAKIGILDCDFHYGDGTADILRRKPELARRVCHQTSGRFFHDGDEPLEFFAWLHGAIEELNRFGCDVVIYQAGADMHIKDPLGGLLDDAEMALRDRMVFTEVRGGLVWNLAGGYRKDGKGGIGPVLETHRRTLIEANIAANTRWAI